MRPISFVSFNLMEIEILFFQLGRKPPGLVWFSKNFKNSGAVSAVFHFLPTDPLGICNFIIADKLSFRVARWFQSHVNDRSSDEPRGLASLTFLLTSRSWGKICWNAESYLPLVQLAKSYSSFSWLAHPVPCRWAVEWARLWGPRTCCDWKESKNGIWTYLWSSRD